MSSGIGNVVLPNKPMQQTALSFSKEGHCIAVLARFVKRSTAMGWRVVTPQLMGRSVMQHCRSRSALAVHLVVALVLGTACGIAPSLVDNASRDPNEVYAAIIETEFIRAGTERVVIGEDPYVGSMMGVADLRRHFSGTLPAGLAEGYQLVSENPKPIDVASIVLSLPMIAFSSDARDSLRVPTGDAEVFWRRFYQWYPNSPGVIRFSDVAFSEDGLHALVTVIRGCGSLCGEVGIAYMRHTAAGWAVADLFVFMRS